VFAKQFTRKKLRKKIAAAKARSDIRGVEVLCGRAKRRAGPCDVRTGRSFLDAHGGRLSFEQRGG
jgi:hypothetical protein